MIVGIDGYVVVLTLVLQYYAIINVFFILFVVILFSNLYVFVYGFDFFW